MIFFWGDNGWGFMDVSGRCINVYCRYWMDCGRFISLYAAMMDGCLWMFNQLFNG